MPKESVFSEQLWSDDYLCAKLLSSGSAIAAEAARRILRYRQLGSDYRITVGENQQESNDDEG